MSKLQTIILPRNWLFGRLNYINNNLNNMISSNLENFTGKERKELEKAHASIIKGKKGKKENSETLKKYYNATKKEK